MKYWYPFSFVYYFSNLYLKSDKEIDNSAYFLRYDSCHGTKYNGLFAVNELRLELKIEQILKKKNKL